ncbi:MAG: hypothetical protein Q9222_002873 [Ikaeria aurantiellina]
MDSLSSEILRLVFLAVIRRYCVSPAPADSKQLIGGGRPTEDLKNVSSVCRRFYAVAVELLFQSIELPLTGWLSNPVHPIMQWESPQMLSLRSHVKHVFIPIPQCIGADRNEDTQKQFISLLPHFPRLKTIMYVILNLRAYNRLSDLSFGECHPSVWGNDGVHGILPESLQAIERLDRTADLSIQIGCLDPTIARYDHLENLRSVTHLSVFLLSRLSLGFDEPIANHLGILTRILCTNPRLRSFHLVVDRSKVYGGHGSHHNFPFLDPPCFQHLQDLYLEGDLAFREADWIRWDACVDWTKIVALRLVYLPLMLEVLGHCLDRLPRLRILQLNVHRGGIKQEDRIPLIAESACSAIKHFLSSITFTELDLTGLTREIPLNIIVDSSGGHLRRLRLHIDLQKKHLNGRAPLSLPDLHLSEAIFLDADRLMSLNKGCPQLNHLGLDVENTKDGVPVSLPSTS